MNHLVAPVFYLENEDFDRNGNLSNKDLPDDMAVLVFIQADSCGYCVKAKPHFQNFANEFRGKGVLFATIHGDSPNVSEQKLVNRINKINPNFVGFPDYVLFYKGKRLNRQIKSRDREGLYIFVEDFLQK